MIWAGAYPPEADEPTTIFAKLGAIFYLPVEPKEWVRIKIIEPTSFPVKKLPNLASTQIPAKSDLKIIPQNTPLQVG